MHDTHDVRKSKELHDKEMLIDQQREPTPVDLSEDQVFRSELLDVLRRIAKALEYIDGGIIHVRDQY